MCAPDGRTGSALGPWAAPTSAPRWAAPPAAAAGPPATSPPPDPLRLAPRRPSLRSWPALRRRPPQQTALTPVALSGAPPCDPGGVSSDGPEGCGGGGAGSSAGGRGSDAGAGDGREASGAVRAEAGPRAHAAPSAYALLHEPCVPTPALVFATGPQPTPPPHPRPLPAPPRPPELGSGHRGAQAPAHARQRGAWAPGRPLCAAGLGRRLHKGQARELRAARRRGGTRLTWVMCHAMDGRACDVQPCSPLTAPRRPGRS
jgi:hypothetical protein